VRAGVARYMVARYMFVACALLVGALPGMLSGSDIDHINVPAPQSVPEPWSTQKEGYNIHIYESPNSPATDADRAVLVLGMWSGPAAVKDAASLTNPATNRPYDVIIGLGSDSKLDELNRVIAKDHLDATANAKAMAEAIDEHFGQPLVAHTLDLHSNGNTVGITALLQGQGADAGAPVAFQGVKAVNSLGPDIGYGGRYLDADHLQALQAAGVDNVDVYRINGDIVPELGVMTKAIASIATDAYVADAFKAVAQRVHDDLQADSAARQGSDSAQGIIHYHDATSPGPWLWWSPDGGIDYAHFVSHYVEVRSGELSDTPPPPDVQAAAQDEETAIEKALADNDLDELANCLHRLGVSLGLADRLADRERINALMQQLEARRVQLDQRRLDLRIEQLRQQEQQYLTNSRQDKDGLTALEQVITVRERQKQDATHQQEIFAQWAERNSPPQPFPSPDNEESSSPPDILSFLDSLLPDGPNDTGNSSSSNNGNVPRPPPERTPPHVPMPAPDPFQGM
jgi:hypothetical protein